MRRLAKCLFIVFVLTAAASVNAVDRIQVVAQVDTSKDIYIGESFSYHVIIDGENKPGQVDLTPLAKYSPQSAGNRDVSQTSITFDGRTTRQNVTKRFVMSYSLTSQTHGTILLPSITVTVDGKKYQTNPVELNVLKPGTTDKLDLEVALSERQCYVGQPVIMAVRFYVSAEIGDFQLDIPALHKTNLFYFEDPDVVDPTAKQYRISAAIPEPVFVTQSRVVHKGRNCTLLSFSKVLIPKRSGKIELEAASVSANVVVGRSRDFFGFQPRYRRFMVSANRLALTVLPLPEQGKPNQFYGLVGRYTISASAAPTTVNVGDPITLTIKIGGSKYLKPIQWPALEKVPQLTAGFKIPSQRSSPAIQNGFKVFTQTIRACNNDVAAIPPIPLAFFDPDKGRYVVASTAPIELSVAPTEKLTPADLEGRDFRPVNKEVEAIKVGLSANYEGLDALRNQTFSLSAAVLSPAYATIWAVPFAALVLSSLLKFLTRTSPERVALKRRRSAFGRALRQLTKISSADPRQRPELLASIMKQYVGERFDRTVGSLTADDCYEVIVAAAQDTRTADKYRETIAEFEAARYASVETSVAAEQIKQVIGLVRHIEKKSRK